MRLGSQLEERQRSGKQDQQDHNWKQIMGWRHRPMNVQLMSAGDPQLMGGAIEGVMCAAWFPVIVRQQPPKSGAIYCSRKGSERNSP